MRRLKALHLEVAPHLKAMHLEAAPHLFALPHLDSRRGAMCRPRDSAPRGGAVRQCGVVPQVKVRLRIEVGRLKARRHLEAAASYLEASPFSSRWAALHLDSKCGTND